MLLAAYVLGLMAVLYFYLYVHTWSERAWSGPNRTEIPLWRWLVIKATHEKDDDGDRS